MKTIILEEKSDVVKLGDKVEFHYEMNEVGSGLKEMLSTISGCLQKEGVSIALDVKEPEKLFDQLESVRRCSGLNAGAEQEDVYGFILKIMGKM